MSINEQIKSLEQAGYKAVAGFTPDTVLIQEPVFVGAGAAAGRFLEFRAVTVPADQVEQFIAQRK